MVDWRKTEAFIFQPQPTFPKLYFVIQTTRNSTQSCDTIKRDGKISDKPDVTIIQEETNDMNNLNQAIINEQLDNNLLAVNN